MEAHPENVPLLGGVCGAALGVDAFDIYEGLVVRKTYAHVMSPYILAFRQPERSGQHHPAPWKSARGGVWTDVEIEIALQQDCRPTRFDRLNTLWWTLALLRLSSGAPLRMPVVSDTSFATVPEGSVEPNLWPLETSHRQFAMTANPPKVLRETHLRWVAEVIVPGEDLINDPAFSRVFQTFDGSVWAHSSGSALITIWSALETMIQPGRMASSKRLASCLAALLEPPGPERERLFQPVKLLYQSRSGSAHASRSPAVEQLMSSFDVGRRAFMTCIDNRVLPQAAVLHERWRLKQ